MIAWFRQNYQMPLIVGVGIFVSGRLIQAGNWSSAIPMSAIAFGVALNIVAMITFIDVSTSVSLRNFEMIDFAN